MIREAAEHGDVIIVANSDAWLMRKKGYVFMPFEERRAILKEIKGVIMVAAVDGGSWKLFQFGLFSAFGCCWVAAAATLNGTAKVTVEAKVNEKVKATVT